MRIWYNKDTGKITAWRSLVEDYESRTTRADEDYVDKDCSPSDIVNKAISISTAELSLVDVQQPIDAKAVIVAELESAIARWDTMTAGEIKVANLNLLKAVKFLLSR